MPAGSPNTRTESRRSPPAVHTVSAKAFLFWHTAAGLDRRMARMPLAASPSMERLACPGRYGGYRPEHCCGCEGTSEVAYANGAIAS
jgi:hypothetical protein